MTNLASKAFFITKYDNSGNLIFARNVSSSLFDKGNGITTDAQGSVFLVGEYQYSLTFDTTASIHTKGSQDVFLVKFDSSGNALWSRSAGGTDTDKGYGICTDNSGSVYITGYFNSDSITFGNITLPNRGMFVTKYDNSGNVIWAKGEGGGYSVGGKSIVTDRNGSIIVAGEFNSPSITFDGTTLLNPTTTTTALNVNYYVAKLNSTTGIGELIADNSISIYPNPFTSQTTISFSSEQTNTSIKITDVVGKEIKTINFTGTQYILEKGIMKAGIYFVQITSFDKLRMTQEVVNRKVVVQ